MKLIQNNIIALTDRNYAPLFKQWCLYVQSSKVPFLSL